MIATLTFRAKARPSLLLARTRNAGGRDDHSCKDLKLSIANWRHSRDLPFGKGKIARGGRCRRSRFSRGGSG
jgi:hypothetical protein